MMKRLIIGACAVMLLAGVAFAQTAGSPPAPPQGEQMDRPDDGPDGQGKDWKHHGRGHGGMGPMMGMMMKGKGFAVMAGPGHGLRVSCGEEPIKDCITAAQPLIEAFNKAEIPAPKAQ